MKFLPDARTGKGAVVGILTTATGEVVGAQLGYVGPQGRKSTVQPQRQMFFIEKSDQAAFRVPVAEPVEGAAPIVLAEGLEDTLSIAQAGAAHEALGVPGIARLGKLALSSGTEAVIFKDGDATDSEAAKQLGGALDRWLLAGVQVRVTDTPAGQDANSLLIAKGSEELRRLVAEAEPPMLGFNAEVVGLAGLEAVQYERERQAVAKRPDVRVGFLDAAVKAACADARQAWIEATGTPPPSKPADAAQYLEQVLPEAALSRWPRTSTGGLSTATEQLEKVAHLPAIRPLLAIKKAEKLLSAFGPKLRRLVNPETARLHSHYNVAGTKAGRWSASDPNVQQLPHDADTRRIIVAAPANVLIGVDYSQMELRAAAWISGDAELTLAYEQGLDVHVLTAAAINGIEPEAVTKQQRAAAKAVNFGSIYGMSAKGLSAAAWSGYGIELAEADAKAALDRFFDKYSGLRQWMRTHADACTRARGVVIGAGRVVENAWEGKYGLGYPQMCNLPVQGICADCMMRAIALVHAELPGVLVAMVHDELLAEAPAADADATAEILKACLHRAFVATFPDAPTLGLVDAQVGASWADLK